MTNKELRHSAPKLASIQKFGTGFALPIAYFNTIEESFFNQLFLEDLSKEPGYTIPGNYFKTIEKKLAPKLQIEKEKIAANNVPEGYFERLEDLVFERLNTEKKPKVFSLKKHWIAVAVAASLLLFIGIYNPFTQNKDLKITEIEAWIDAGYLGLNSYEIAAIYETEIDDLVINNQINTKDLEIYLTDEFYESIFYD